MTMTFFSYFGNHPWLLVAVIAVFQIVVVAFTLKRLWGIKHFWKYGSWEITTNEDGLTLIENNSQSSEERYEMIDEINKYIVSHNGAVEFGVIKEKVESKLNSMYEYATSMIQVPTYLGLLGTFVGVWFGLECFQNGLGHAESTVTDGMIRELLGGIIVSMITSVIGLVLMIFTKFWADKVLNESDKSLADCLQFIRDEIIPELGTNVTSSLNRLQNTIRKFEPSFRAVIDDFKSAFSDCTDMFKGTFSENVTVLTQAVSAMGSNMQLVNDNIQKQDQLLTTLRHSSLVETLDKFVAAAASFESVSETIEKLEDVRERISLSTATFVERQESFNNSLEIPQNLITKINAVLDRVSTFERSLNDFGENMNQTQLFRNEQLNLIEEQLRALRAKTDAVKGYQDVQVEELKDIYRVQKEAVDKLALSFRQAVDNNSSDMEATMAGFKTLYERVVNECRSGVERKLDEFVEALNKSLDFVDAGKKLDNLSRLQTIDKSVEDLKLAAQDKAILADISNALQVANSKLDNLGKRSVSSTVTGASLTPKKRHWYSSFFSRSSR